MAFKLLDPVLTVCTTMTCKSNTFLRKSKLLCLLSTKRQFCSKRDSGDTSDTPKTDDPPDKPKIEDLLNSASPLRSANVDNFWATSPYPEGTVFREFERENKEEQIPGRRTVGSNKSVIMFPGQGNQFVGMGKNLLKYPVALDLFKTASDILGYDLLKICLEGPEHVLNDTKYCQPATFVCSMALLEKVKDEKPWAISDCIAACGYSLGELTALVFAGVMNFEIGLNLVKIRAEAMAKCCEKAKGGMLTIFTGPGTNLNQAMSDAIEHCKSVGIETPQCNIASYLFPNCKVIAGNIEALDFLRKNAKKYRILRHSTLPVSGAFHTLLMKDAEEPFIEKLEKIDLKEPLVKVYSNVTAKPYRNSDHILKILPKQIYCPIKWEQTMQNVLSNQNSDFPSLYECGPGSSLITVAAKVNSKASLMLYPIEM